MPLSAAAVRAVSGALRPVPYSIVLLRRRDQSRLASRRSKYPSITSTSQSVRGGFPVPPRTTSKHSGPRLARQRAILTSPSMGQARVSRHFALAAGRCHLHVWSAGGQPMSGTVASDRLPNVCAVARSNSTDWRHSFDRCVMLSSDRVGWAAGSASLSARGVP